MVVVQIKNYKIYLTLLLADTEKPSNDINCGKGFITVRFLLSVGKKYCLSAVVFSRKPCLGSDNDLFRVKSSQILTQWSSNGLVIYIVLSRIFPVKLSVLRIWGCASKWSSLDVSFLPASEFLDQ